MPRYIVLSPAKVSGQVHKPGGESVELTEKAAAPAVASGSLKPVAVEPAPGGKKAKE